MNSIEEMNKIHVCTHSSIYLFIQQTFVNAWYIEGLRIEIEVFHLVKSSVSRGTIISSPVTRDHGQE